MTENRLSFTIAVSLCAMCANVAAGQPAATAAKPVVSQAGAPAAATAEAGPSWDIDVRSYENQERVAHYVEWFAGSARARITARLERGSRYEAMIRGKMRAGGVPEDMYYLALVESGFDQHAYSRAAAVGMWQFMASTGRSMGLRIDPWVDERRDPVRSTTAAVRYLKGLSVQFGSLYLAAAAYNGGPVRVARGLARYADILGHSTGDDAFFVLAEKDYLKNETREYVPQLIAAALVAKDPSRYGMDLRTLPSFVYDSVSVPGGTPLAAVAMALGVAIPVLLELNPHLLRGMTPPRGTWSVRVPEGHGTGFEAAFDAIAPDHRLATRPLRTKKGDTAPRLASGQGISEWALRAFNPTLRTRRNGQLVPDQALLVPTPAVAAAALQVPDPVRNGKGARTRS